ncbi:flavodoxin domain-containing protein [Alkaliphilus transvaalensis]|uniref:flavodoxin domain-containing protein n=1 Tax=Alkaliphilus transvaalensis TaxID=114628 RepID=UPI00047DA9AE|nr:flavodoxin domain-containing protein [Alkaliphilus transvaalensis]
MKVVLLYASKYGATEKAAKLMAEQLKGEVKLINLKEEIPSTIEEFDTVLLASSIYAGRMQGEISKFTTTYKDQIMNKNIGVFVCCKEENPEKITEYLKLNLPEEMIKKAFIKEYLGHEVKFDKMNFFERFLLKRILKVKESYSQINLEGIKRVSNIINEMDVANG